MVFRHHEQLLLSTFRRSETTWPTVCSTCLNFAMTGFKSKLFSDAESWSQGKSVNTCASSWMALAACGLIVETGCETRASYASKHIDGNNLSGENNEYKAYQNSTLVTFLTTEPPNVEKGLTEQRSGCWTGPSNRTRPSLPGSRGRIVAFAC